MQPIHHDRHCASCHENARHFGASDPAAHDGSIESTAPRSAAKSPTVVAHASTAQVHATLIEFYAKSSKVDSQLSQEPSADEPSRAVPGQAASLSETGWRWVQVRVAEAERRLFDRRLNGCGYCHTSVAKDDDGWRVEPPRIPDRWFGHGRFRHDRHTPLACSACHVEARNSSATSDVLLPGIGRCQSCHASSPVGRMQGVARTDCVECHDYHDRAVAPFQGGLSLGLLSDDRGQGENH
jgi:hypothetical protein